MATDKLKPIQVKNAQPREKDYKLFDGGGLFLLVRKDGSKYWRLKYRFGGKEKLLALGVYPEVSLAEARGERSDAKKLLRDKQDPGLLRKQEKSEQKIAGANTFEAVAMEWWENKKGDWSENHANRVLGSLKRDAFPSIGHQPVSEIQPPEVLALVRKVESRDALDVAGRVLQRCSSVFRYAVQTGRATVNPASELTGALKTRKVEHRAAVTRAGLPHPLRAV